jgi:biopolymer transport protein ExbB
MMGKTRRSILALVACGAVFGLVAAEEGAPSVEGSARTDLEKSTRELGELRAKVADELVPLSKELGRLEAKLAADRQSYQDATRRQDTGNLDFENRNNELKLRQDETTYVANLMTEYAKGFQSTMIAGEWPKYEATVQGALDAPQDQDLSTTERLSRQTKLLDQSISRVDDLLGGARFPGEAVSPEGTVQKGYFAAIGPVVLFAAQGGGVAGLALPQAGSATPAVRPLESNGAGKDVTHVIDSGSGTFPLDPTRGGALAQLIQRGSLWGYFKKGGPIMYPLLLISILAVTVVIERLVFLAKEGSNRSPEDVQDILGHVGRGDIESAVRTGSESRDYIAKAMTYALVHRNKSFSDALSRAATQEVIRYERGISILDTVVTMAPLLGLLGTVTGMMGSFGMLGGAELSAPAQITGGIAEALIATAFGLSIAITTLVPLNYLHRKNERARHDVEDAATHLELLMKPILAPEPYVPVRVPA